jgi:histidine triad (HIT) family protein
MCIFCKILNKELSADIVYEDDKILAFNDIHPKAPVHILIIPKEHIISVDYLEEKNKEIIGELVLAAKRIAKTKGLSTGYKLAINVGKDGGQEVDHLHLHLLGGKK